VNKKSTIKKSAGAKTPRRPLTKDDGIDYSDIPDMAMNTTFWASVKPFVPPPPKAQLTIRLDQDVRDWFRDQGKGYQTHINRALRLYIDHHASAVQRPGRRKEF
jgi:uncharacterized protein (DUF4415 family)